MMKSKEIIQYLDELIPNPRCELNYNKDYELLIATMLSAQTTDKRVNMVTEVLFEKYPDLKSLAEASIDDLINIIRPVGTFRRKAQNIKLIAEALLLKSDGIVPNDRLFLESLSGVGRKTANVVLSNLFNESCIAVDTHVSRVSKRLNIANKNDDVYKVEKKLNKFFAGEQLGRIHHQLVLFGRYYCKAIKPNCESCKLKKYCKKNS
ncbi:MAG: endonuclease III [Firmicutes bacterium]|nr:endonuclease III [Bacillota bacterium]